MRERRARRSHILLEEPALFIDGSDLAQPPVMQRNDAPTGANNNFYARGLERRGLAIHSVDLSLGRVRTEAVNAYSCDGTTGITADFVRLEASPVPIAPDEPQGITAAHAFTGFVPPS